MKTLTLSIASALLLTACAQQEPEYLCDRESIGMDKFGKIILREECKPKPVRAMPTADR